ncbi:hypothetical protein G9A89_017494 [Geosiphon pyriformis]|nr:hypothetical protein G9A89_017494 [Geosiphon pyriformis]
MTSVSSLSKIRRSTVPLASSSNSPTRVLTNGFTSPKKTSIVLSSPRKTAAAVIKIGSPTASSARSGKEDLISKRDRQQSADNKELKKVKSDPERAENGHDKKRSSKMESPSVKHRKHINGHTQKQTEQKKSSISHKDKQKQTDVKTSHRRIGSQGDKKSLHSNIKSSPHSAEEKSSTSIKTPIKKEPGPVTRQRSKGKDVVADHYVNDDGELENEEDDGEKNADLSEYDQTATKKNKIEKSSNKHKSKSRKRKKLFDVTDPTGILTPQDNDHLRDLASVKEMLKRYRKELIDIKEGIQQFNAEKTKDRPVYDDKNECIENKDQISGNNERMQDNEIDEYYQHGEPGLRKIGVNIRNNRYHPYQNPKRVHMIEQTLQRTTFKVAMTESRVSRLEVKFISLQKKYQAWNRLLKEETNTHDGVGNEGFLNATESLRENFVSMFFGFSLGTISIFVARQIWISLF